MDRNFLTMIFVGEIWKIFYRKNGEGRAGNKKNRGKGKKY
jgi:hypothetical protein